MQGVVPDRKDARVNRRMECFHPSVQDLRESGDFGDRLRRHSGVLQRPMGSPGGNNLHAKLFQTVRQLSNALLIRNTDQRAANFEQRTLLTLNMDMVLKCRDLELGYCIHTILSRMETRCS